MLVFYGIFIAKHWQFNSNYEAALQCHKFEANMARLRADETS